MIEALRRWMLRQADHCERQARRMRSKALTAQTADEAKWYRRAAETYDAAAAQWRRVRR